MHLMLIDVVRAHRRKRSRPHMQRHEGMRDIPRAQRCKHCLVEMQSGGRGRDRAERASVHRLIALPVRLLGAAIDVGRQRHLPVRLKELDHVAGEPQHKQLALAPDHGGALAARELHGGPVLQALAGAHMHQRRIRAQRPLQQQFDPSAAVLHAISAGRNDARIVENQQIPRLEQRRKIAKLAVLDAAGATLERQQPAAGALRGGLLGNEFLGQLEVKVRAQHCL